MNRSLLLKTGVKFVIPAALMSICFYCSFSAYIAGTATETTNGYVRGSDGKPVSNAKVQSIDAEHWLAKTILGNPVVAESTFTDTNGRFTIRIPRTFAQNLQITAADEGLLVSNVNDFSVNPACSLRLVLKPYAKINGSLNPAASLQTMLLFSGTACSIPLLADNTFHAAALPEGVFPLVVVRRNPASVQTSLAGVYTLLPGDSVNTGVISADTGRIPVEDFSLGWVRTNLGRLISGGYWYHMIDTGGVFQGTSSISMSVQSTGAFKGSSLQTKVCLGNGYIYPFGGVGFNVGNPYSEGYNFSQMKKLSFMARGHGIIHVTIKTKLLEKIKDNWDHFGIQISLPANWTKIEIPVDSLKLIPGSPAALAGVKWQQASLSAKLIEFAVMHQFTAVGDTVEYWLDDIAFEGMSIGFLTP